MNWFDVGRKKEKRKVMSEVGRNGGHENKKNERTSRGIDFKENF